MFNEIGPFYVSTDNFPELLALPYTWNKDVGLVFMDNPVGTVSLQKKKKTEKILFAYREL